METTDIEDAVQTTTGHFFPDGTAIELMRKANDQRTVLVRWKDENFEIADRVEYSGTMYTAAADCSEHRAGVALASTNRAAGKH